MNAFRKSCLPAVLTGLMCTVMLAPAIVFPLHLAAACHSSHSDCPDRPLSPHQSHKCLVCLIANAVVGKSLCPALAVICQTTMPVLSIHADPCDAVGSLYPHTKISRAPPLA